MQNIKTVNIVNKQTILTLKKCKYVCTHCGKRFCEHYDFVAKHHHIAKNVFAKIIDDLKELRSMWRDYADIKIYFPDAKADIKR